MTLFLCQLLFLCFPLKESACNFWFSRWLWHKYNYLAIYLLYLLFLLLIFSCLNSVIKQRRMFLFSVQYIILVHLIYSSKYYIALNLILFTFIFLIKNKITCILEFTLRTLLNTCRTQCNLSWIGILFSMSFRSINSWKVPLYPRVWQSP